MIRKLDGMIGNIPVLFDLLYHSEITDAEYFERGGYEVCRLSSSMDTYFYTRVEVPVQEIPMTDIRDDDEIVVTFSLPKSFILTLTFTRKEFEFNNLEQPPDRGWARLYYSGVVDSAFDCKVKDKAYGDLRVWNDVTMEQIEHDLTILYLTIKKREPYEYE